MIVDVFDQRAESEWRNEGQERATELGNGVHRDCTRSGAQQDSDDDDDDGRVEMSGVGHSAASLPA